MFLEVLGGWGLPRLWRTAPPFEFPFEQRLYRSVPSICGMLLKHRKHGGEGGIRTHGTRKGSTVFETARFNRSRTSPASKKPASAKGLRARASSTIPFASAPEISAAARSLFPRAD